MKTLGFTKVLLLPLMISGSIMGSSIASPTPSTSPVAPSLTGQQSSTASRAMYARAYAHAGAGAGAHARAGAPPCGGGGQLLRLARPVRRP